MKKTLLVVALALSMQAFCFENQQTLSDKAHQADASNDPIATLDFTQAKAYKYETYHAIKFPEGSITLSGDPEKPETMSGRYINEKLPVTPLSPQHIAAILQKIPLKNLGNFGCVYTQPTDNKKT